MYRQRFSSRTTKSTLVNGKSHDSRFEAGVAEELEEQLQNGQIKGYDDSYKIEIWCYRADGVQAFKVEHKVDFRVQHLDGSFELIEAKGKEFEDYKWRRKFIENIWLPEHPDHTYTVVKQRSFGGQPWRR